MKAANSKNFTFFLIQFFSLTFAFGTQDAAAEPLDFSVRWFRTENGKPGFVDLDPLKQNAFTEGALRAWSAHEKSALEKLKVSAGSIINSPGSIPLLSVYESLDDEDFVLKFFGANLANGTKTLVLEICEKATGLCFVSFPDTKTIPEELAHLDYWDSNAMDAFTKLGSYKMLEQAEAYDEAFKELLENIDPNTASDLVQKDQAAIETLQKATWPEDSRLAIEASEILRLKLIRKWEEMENLAPAYLLKAALQKAKTPEEVAQILNSDNLQKSFGKIDRVKFLTEILQKQLISVKDSELGHGEVTLIFLDGANKSDPTQGIPIFRISEKKTQKSFVYLPKIEGLVESKHFKQFLARQHLDAGRSDGLSGRDVVIRFMDDIQSKGSKDLYNLFSYIVEPKPSLLTTEIKKIFGVNVPIPFIAWGRDWWRGTVKGSDKSTALFGAVCGIVQAGLTCIPEAIGALQGHDFHVAPVALSAAFGSTIGMFISTYKNIMNRGVSQLWRATKSGSIGALFTVLLVYFSDKGLSSFNVTTLAGVSFTIAAAVNIIVQQYAKTSWYNFARIRERLNITRGAFKFNVPLLGQVQWQKSAVDNQVMYAPPFTIKQLDLLEAIESKDWGLGKILLVGSVPWVQAWNLSYLEKLEKIYGPGSQKISDIVHQRIAIIAAQLNITPDQLRSVLDHGNPTIYELMAETWDQWRRSIWGSADRILKKIILGRDMNGAIGQSETIFFKSKPAALVEYEKKHGAVISSQTNSGTKKEKIKRKEFKLPDARIFECLTSLSTVLRGPVAIPN